MNIKYITIMLLISFSNSTYSETIFRTDPKSYHKSLKVDQFYSESDFIFKEYIPLEWIDKNQTINNVTPLITNQKSNFNQNFNLTVLQERIINHIYNNVKINQDIVKTTSKEERTINKIIQKEVQVSKTNTVFGENKNNCSEWTPSSDTKFPNEMVSQTQECEVDAIETYRYTISDNIVETKSFNVFLNKTFEREIQGTKQIASNSCLDILNSGKSTGNGNYLINANGTDKMVYCDMTGGGWTLYDEFDGVYLSKKPYNATIQNLEDFSANGYNTYITYYGNSHPPASIELRNGHQMFYYGSEPKGFIEKSFPFSKEIKINYGNPYFTATCTLYQDNVLKSTVVANSVTSVILNVTPSNVVKLVEEYGICSIDSIWFK